MPEHRERDAREHIALLGAAVRPHPLAGLLHVRRVFIVARELEREISLDRGAEVAGAAFVQGPAAVDPLTSAQIYRKALLSRAVYGAHEVVQEKIFRGDGGIGLEVEAPVAVVCLPAQHGLRGTRERLLHGLGRRLGRDHRRMQGFGSVNA